MNILMISNIDDDEKLEDIWLARAFQEDGHQVAIVDRNYDERLEKIFDVFLQRNTWSSNATLEKVQETKDFSKRIISKNLKRINFDGKFDGKDKTYLVDLFKQGYPVIPTIDNLSELHHIGISDKYLLKLKDSYDGVGQIIVTKEELKDKFTDSYVLQPFETFTSEIQFYYINNKFEYALEFLHGKLPIYPDAKIYHYNSQELELANSFARLNGDYYGIQRIDFLKMTDGSLLLTEIEDVAPYLDLDCVPATTRNKFIDDYKNMVYEYIEKNK